MKCADLKIRAPAAVGKWPVTYKAAQGFSWEPLGQGCVPSPQQTKPRCPCRGPSTDIPLGKRWRTAQGISLCLGARLLLSRVCSPWAIKGLERQESCGPRSLPSSPCFSGLWRTLCRGVFVPASEMLSLSTLSCVLPWSCSAFLPKQGCSPRLVSVLVIRRSSDEKPFGHGVARDRWSPATGGH